MVDNKELEMQALISERLAWMVKNESEWYAGQAGVYTEEDFLDMSVALRQLNGEEINME